MINNFRGLTSSPRLLSKVSPAPEPMALMVMSIQKLPERKHLRGVLSLYVSAVSPATKTDYTH
jgi:hypothetical protein